MGRFGANWQTTYVERYQSVDSDTGLFEPRRVGVEVADSGIPRWRSTLRLNWALQPYAATYALRHISSLTEGANGKLGAVTYHDLQASYTLPKAFNTTLTGGINNLFDQDPPVCVSCSLNGYDASVYDLPGTFAYVSAAVKF